MEPPSDPLDSRNDFARPRAEDSGIVTTFAEGFDRARAGEFMIFKNIGREMMIEDENLQGFTLV